MLEKFFKNGQPSNALLELLEVLGIKHDGTLIGIRDATQKSWYQSGKFRAEIKENPEYLVLKDKLMSIFRELGLVEGVFASKLSYDIALIHGGTLPAVQKRIAFLAQEWKRGVRFKIVSFLGSQRKIISDKEDPCKIEKEVWGVPFNIEKTPIHYEHEFEMMSILYEVANLPWKNEIPLRFLFPAKENANTKETTREWYERFKGEAFNSLLFISSQPFVSFQQIVVKKVIFDREVETIGYSAPQSIPITAYLDNIAKIIYELSE
jgi:hypothetical protein